MNSTNRLREVARRYLTLPIRYGLSRPNVKGPWHTEAMFRKQCWVFALVLFGCGHKTIDTEAARKLSDEFMSDWIAHRPDAAFNKMETEFSKTVDRSGFAKQLEKLSQYCGWPQDSELKDVMSGYKAYGDGHTNPTRKFIYAANTDQFKKGQCYFSVEVAPSSQGVRVTSFGPLKVTSGNPYP